MLLSLILCIIVFSISKFYSLDSCLPLPPSVYHSSQNTSWQVKSPISTKLSLLSCSYSYKDNFLFFPCSICSTHQIEDHLGCTFLYSLDPKILLSSYVALILLLHIPNWNITGPLSLPSLSLFSCSEMPFLWLATSLRSLWQYYFYLCMLAHPSSCTCCYPCLPIL